MLNSPGDTAYLTSIGLWNQCILQSVPVQNEKLNRWIEKEKTSKQSFQEAGSGVTQNKILALSVGLTFFSFPRDKNMRK